MTLSDYCLGTPEPNRKNYYEALSENVELDIVVNVETKVIKPPPLYITSVENVRPLIDLLNKIAKEEFEIKILKLGELKVQAFTEEKYSSITKSLIEKNTELHGYKIKEERPFNAVIKGLDHSTPIYDIKSELESISFELDNVSNIKHLLTKPSLSMFYVNLKQH